MAENVLHQVKVLIYKMICQPWIGKVIGYVFRRRIPTNGLVIDTDSPQVTALIRAVMFWGFYEREEVQLLNQYLRSDLDCVELGSSLGVVSSHIGRRQENARKLICVEANPELIGKIEANITHNCPGKAHVIYNRAVDYSGEDHVFLRSGDDNTASRVSGQEGSGWSVETCTLSEILAENDIDDFALVADIEGAEIEIFLNDAKALKRCKQLLIELHNTSSSGHEYSIADMADMLVNTHGFSFREQREAAYIFER